MFLGMRCPMGLEESHPDTRATGELNLRLASNRLEAAVLGSQTFVFLRTCTLPRSLAV